MLYTPKCYDWSGKEVPFSYLQGIYGFQIHDGLDHLPAGIKRAWYPTVIQERGGKVTLAATAGAPLFLIGAGYTATYPDGRLTFPMNMNDHAYQPKKGEYGSIGIKVRDSVPSAYIDRLGIAWNAHAVDQLPPSDQGNNYMHCDTSWGIVDLEAPTPPVNPPSDPTPITGGIWLTADEVQRLRGSLLNVDDILRTATNRPPTRTA